MIQLIDVTVPLHEGLATWPTSSGLTLRTERWEEGGDTITNSYLEADVHCGTHVEAPRHFLDDGPGLEELGLAPLVGRAEVVHLPEDAGVIDATVLDGLVIDAEVTRILFKTTNGRFWPEAGEFREDYVALDESGAAWCVERGVELVGIDYLSIQSRQAGPETHRTLMRAGIAIVEGLDLRAVDQGSYELWCLPVRLAEVEAAPARVVLRPLPDAVS